MKKKMKIATIQSSRIMTQNFHIVKADSRAVQQSKNNLPKDIVGVMIDSALIIHVDGKR
jgi:hypothetical protein